MGFSLSPKLGSDLSMLVHRRSMLSQTLVRFPTATQLSLLGQSSAAAFGRRALSRRHSTRFSRHTFERWVQCWLALMPLPSLRLWIWDSSLRTLLTISRLSLNCCGQPLLATKLSQSQSLSSGECPTHGQIGRPCI